MHFRPQCAAGKWVLLLGDHSVTVTMPVDLVELSTIPTPSPLQIRKDLQRESLCVNGLLYNGSSGFH